VPLYFDIKRTVQEFTSRDNPYYLGFHSNILITPLDIIAGSFEVETAVEPE